MNVLKISVIVPVYNVAKYLRRCIDSILSQSFTDFELLLIDDGSKDGSGGICDEYAAKDNRIRVFHKENGGVSSARNLGLDNAKGEWIYFVDADDEIVPEALQTIFMGMDKQHDVVLCGFEKCRENGEVVFRYNGDVFNKTLTKEECTYAVFIYDFYGYYYLGWMWVWAFRKELIKNHGLRFSEQIQVKEDTLFVVQYVCRCVKSCFFSTKPIYRYYEASTGIMQLSKKRFEPKYVTSFKACMEIYHEIRSLYPANHPLSLLAKHTVWDRYYIIRGRMKEFEYRDSELLSSLCKQALEATGVKYVIQYQIERNKRRCKSFIKRRLLK